MVIIIFVKLIFRKYKILWTGYIVTGFFTLYVATKIISWERGFTGKSGCTTVIIAVIYMWFSICPWEKNGGNLPSFPGFLLKIEKKRKKIEFFRRLPVLETRLLTAVMWQFMSVWISISFTLITITSNTVIIYLCGNFVI